MAKEPLPSATPKVTKALSLIEPIQLPLPPVSGPCARVFSALQSLHAYICSPRSVKTLHSLEKAWSPELTLFLEVESVLDDWAQKHEVRLDRHTGSVDIDFLSVRLHCIPFRQFEPPCNRCLVRTCEILMERTVHALPTTFPACAPTKEAHHRTTPARPSPRAPKRGSETDSHRHARPVRLSPSRMDIADGKGEEDFARLGVSEAERERLRV